MFISLVYYLSDSKQNISIFYCCQSAMSHWPENWTSWNSNDLKADPIILFIPGGLRREREQKQQLQQQNPLILVGANESGWIYLWKGCSFLLCIHRNLPESACSPFSAEMNWSWVKDLTHGYVFQFCLCFQTCHCYHWQGIPTRPTTFAFTGWTTRSCSSPWRLRSCCRSSIPSWRMRTVS